MNRSMKGSITMNKMLLGIATCAASSLASAGTYVESVVTNHFAPQAPPQPMKMWVDGAGKFRLETQKGEQVQIFRDKAFYTLNTATKRYTKTDQASLDAALKKASQATADLRALLPPDQRDKAKSPPAAPPAMERTVKPTTRTETAAGQSCKVWEVYMNNNKVRELCVVEIGKLPYGKDLLSTMQQVNDAFKNSPGSMEAWADVQKMNGFPVITRMYLNGKLFQEVKTTAIRSEKTTDSQFAIPAGFQEQQMPGIG
jgi:hypothetical protein